MASTLPTVKAKHCARDFRQAPARNWGAITHAQKTQLKVTSVQNASALHMVLTPAQNPLLPQVKPGKTEKEKAKAKARKEKAKGSGGDQHHLTIMMIQSLSLSE